MEFRKHWHEDVRTGRRDSARLGGYYSRGEEKEMR
jgi:hypothetical protein